MKSGNILSVIFCYAVFTYNIPKTSYWTSSLFFFCNSVINVVGKKRPNMFCWKIRKCGIVKGQLQTTYFVKFWGHVDVRSLLCCVMPGVATWMLCRCYIIHDNPCMLICHFAGGFTHPSEDCDYMSVWVEKNISPIILFKCIVIR